MYQHGPAAKPRHTRAPLSTTGSSAPKSACGSASRMTTAYDRTNTGRERSATRPTARRPLVQAKKQTPKKGA